MEQFKIDISNVNKILYISIDIALIVNIIVLLIMINLSAGLSIVILLFCLILCIPFASVLFSNISIDNEYVTIFGGVLYQKEIRIENVKNVRLALEEEFILRGNPVYSKSRIVIECTDGERIYISIKEKYEFIKHINNLITSDKELIE